ncbi:hypothetical protein [Mangrovihabitans endophyticus]|uniref:hypothetical protein n=1 Tax=Mangrovihabitans endophyticus TaxID=1751298 RepID=UPI00166C686A|nr:hypothetical protein [Mangrovihabitans endophyticus]
MARSLSAPALFVRLLLAGGIALTGTACSPDGATDASAASAAPGGMDDLQPTSSDAPGVDACSLLKRAVDEGTLMEPGVVDAIVRISGRADAPVADAGRRLAAAYASAAGAHGTEDEPDAVAGVSAAGADMSSVCTDSGLETVG